jgi:hypothetical protein
MEHVPACVSLDRQLEWSDRSDLSGNVVGDFFGGNCRQEISTSASTHQEQCSEDWYNEFIVSDHQDLQSSSQFLDTVDLINRQNNQSDLFGLESNGISSNNIDIQQGHPTATLSLESSVGFDDSSNLEQSSLLNLQHSTQDAPATEFDPQTIFDSVFNTYNPSYQVQDGLNELQWEVPIDEASNSMVSNTTYALSIKADSNESKQVQCFKSLLCSANLTIDTF